MRVLHVISGLDPAQGGPVSALMGLAKALKSHALDVEVISNFTTSGPPATFDELTQAGIPVFGIGPMRGRFSCRRLAWQVLRERIAAADVVHIHGLWEEVQHQASVVARRCHKPYILRPCGMLDPWALQQGGWKKRLYMAMRTRRDLNRACCLHFTSLAEQAQVSGLGLQSRSLVLPNGISLSHQLPVARDGSFRTLLGIPPDRPLVAFLGRVHPGKGVEYLIPAMARMQSTQTVLAIIGPDATDFGTRMKAQASQLGLGDRVRFVGALQGEQKWKALADADLFSLPSEHENFGIAVVEALAAGTPVVISDQVAIWREIVEGGVGAAVPLTPERLAEELDRWILNQDLRLRAAAKARSFALERYDWDHIARRWCEEYRAMTAHHLLPQSRRGA